MTAPTVPSSSSAAIPSKAGVGVSAKGTALQPIFDTLGQLAEDGSVPRNIRRGAQAARDELAKPNVPLDVRVAGAVYLLDDLANDPNLPTHGRTAIWSVISSLESLQ